MLTSNIYHSIPEKSGVNKRRHNRIQFNRKIRLASYVDAPRLVKKKKFENNPQLIEVPCKSVPTVKTPQAIKE